MDSKIKTIQLTENVKKLHNTTNDICPICDNKIKELTSIIKLGKVLYHSKCYFNSTSDSFKIK